MKLGTFLICRSPSALLTATRQVCISMQKAAASPPWNRTKEMAHFYSLTGATPSGELSGAEHSHSLGRWVGCVRKATEMSGWVAETGVRRRRSAIQMDVTVCISRWHREHEIWRRAAGISCCKVLTAYSCLKSFPLCFRQYSKPEDICLSFSLVLPLPNTENCNPFFKQHFFLLFNMY